MRSHSAKAKAKESEAVRASPQASLRHIESAMVSGGLGGT